MSRELIRALREIAKASPDLLKPEYRRRVQAGDNPLTGHCYVLCEAIYHLLPGEFRVRRVEVDGDSHWFLVDGTGEVVDPTAEQYGDPVPYADSVSAAFLTKSPSSRCRTLIARYEQIFVTR